MKNLRLRIRAAWAVLTSENFLTVVRNGDQIDMRRHMGDRDSIRYLTAWANIITGGEKAFNEANEILKNK